MTIDKSVYLLDKDLHFSTRLKSVLVELAKTRSITAEYFDSGFPGIPSISDTISLEFRPTTFPYSKIGLLKIIIHPENATEKPNASIMQLTSDDEANQKLFDDAAERLEKMYSVKHSGPGWIMKKAEDTLLTQLGTELNSRGDYEIDIPKFVDVLFKLGVVKSKEED